VTQALQLYATSALSKPAQLSNSLGADTGLAQQAIGLIGNPNVNMGDFWQQYGQALQSPMDPATFQDWSNAAAMMSQIGTAEQQAISLQQTYNNLTIAQLQEQIQAVQNVKVMVDGLEQSVSSAYSTYTSLNNTLTSSLQGLQWSSTLSPNTPGQMYQEQSAYWNQLSTTVAGEGPDSVSYSADIQKLAAFANTFLTTSKSFYGNSAQYQTDYQNVTNTLSGLQAPINEQVVTLKAQLQAQDQIVNYNQIQIAALQLSNQNLQILTGQMSLLGQDTVTGFNNLTQQMAGVSGVVSSLMTAYSVVSAVMGVPALPGFAEGGSFVVGEQGVEVLTLGRGASGTVSNHKTVSEMFDLTPLHRAATQGNRISAAGFQALVASHHDMRRELAEMRRSSQMAAARRAH
jgi:hypothetical protein